MTRPIGRALLAEFLGTGLLVTAVVGSGIAAARLSPADVGLQLLENAFATALALGVVIVIFGPASGAHVNPIVSIVDWWLGRRDGSGLAGRHVAGYVAAQTAGAVGGAMLANTMYGLVPIEFSSTHRGGPHLWLGEVVATAGLIVLVFALSRTGRTAVAPIAVAAYIGAAYWFTSSTAFANPAVTAGRAVTDTFTGIAPASIGGFMLAQLIGGAIGAGVLALIYPRAHPPGVDTRRAVTAEHEDAAMHEDTVRPVGVRG